MALTIIALPAGAFSLLGPYADWMDKANGFRQPGDIGGPMNLGEEYRWNVPVLTYGFDPSFIEYFGSNGVAAVESAVGILNDLPPASEILLADFPNITKRLNHSAQAQGLMDLQTHALSLLVERMGLAQPTRHMLVLRRWNPVFLTASDDGQWPAGTISTDILERNYDPESHAPDWKVNGATFSGRVRAWPPYEPVPRFADVIERPSNPFLIAETAIADRSFSAGWLCTNLTRDDAGGLRYLLSSNNVNYELLAPGVRRAGGDPDPPVNGAWRPGVEKITFTPHPHDPELTQFVPATNAFTDLYFTNGVRTQQQLERVIVEPDILFTAGDVKPDEAIVHLYERTGLHDWLNLAALNDAPGSAGPGLIAPPVTITFNKLGRQFTVNGPAMGNGTLLLEVLNWASFDQSTTTPVYYPVERTGQVESIARLWLAWNPITNSDNRPDCRFDWPISAPTGAWFVYQSSSNLTEWTTLATFIHDGTITTWLHFLPDSPGRFYRVVPASPSDPPPRR